MGKKYTNETFIIKANEIQGQKYNYDKVDYINAHTKICIICPEHGEFWQKPFSHLKGKGCPICGNIARKKGRLLTKEQFIEKARQVHGWKYDYIKVEYVHSQSKVCIICPEHGEFWMTPENHMRGQGCSKCSRPSVDTKSFISESIKKHGNTYDYSKVDFKNSRTKVCIICPEHGEFWQRPNGHLRGQGCSKCGDKRCADSKFKTTEEFITNAIKIHDTKYDYSKVNYTTSVTPVCIICPEHGEFWQRPTNHLFGKGCPKCKMSHLEREVMVYLNRHNINYKYEVNKSIFEWLGLQSLDFYLPDYNIAIECQGGQHFNAYKRFGGKKGLEKIIQRDLNKIRLCKEHNINLLHYADNRDSKVPQNWDLYDVIIGIENLYNKINECQQK